jgi:hypothetical protein
MPKLVSNVSKKEYIGRLSAYLPKSSLIRSAEVDPLVRSLTYSREEAMPVMPATLRILFKVEA